MIYMFDGVPGSGKSLHLAREVVNALRSGKNVIANFDFRDDLVKPRKNKSLGQFIRVSNDELLNNYIYQKKGIDYRKAPSRDMGFSALLGLEGFARNYHRKNADGDILEHQTLICIDECQDIFNTRTWNRADRLAWCSFFRMHRHMGYDVILASQDDKVVDKQIRAVLQTRITHRNVKNLKTFGFILWLLAGRDLFAESESIYSIKGKAGHVNTKYTKGRKYYKYYRSTAYNFTAV